MSNLKKINKNRFKIITKTKGKIFKYFSIKDKNYHGFGEVYISSIAPKEIRAWKYHKKSYMNLFAINGKVKFVFYCSISKKFKTLKMDSAKNQSIEVPPKIWYGFKNISNVNSSIMNIINLRHSKNEIKSKPLSYIKFNWKKN